MTRQSVRTYWTAKGQISRLQLLAAYLFIMCAFIYANHETREAGDQAKNAIVYYCLQTNARHDATVEAVRNAPPRENVDKTVVVQLIDAMLPVTDDCSRAFEAKLPGR